MVRISKKNDYSSPQYNLCGNQLKAVSEVKDLEIYITSSLLWSMQANKCANKANSVLGFIRRAVGPKNPELFSKLYKSLVCPILEYCSPIWCPHLKVTRPSFLGGHHPTLKLSGIPTFTEHFTEHSEVSQARSLHACWTRMLYNDRLETIDNSQSTNSAKTLEIFNVYSSLGL